MSAGKCKMEEEHENGCKTPENGYCECVDGYTYNSADYYESCNKPESCLLVKYGTCYQCPEGMVQNSQWTDCEPENPKPEENCAHWDNN